MPEMPRPIAIPFKLAAVGLVFCVEPSGDVRAEIQEAVRKALEGLDNVQVDAQFFQWHDVAIKVVTDGQ